MTAREYLSTVWTTWIGRHSRGYSRHRLHSLLEAAVRTHVASGGFGAILNIGAGGEIETELRRLEVKFTSVDIDPARQPDQVMDIEDLSAIGDGTLRAVFLLEVLEHVRRPHRAVDELERVLRPGGVVIGSTPFLLGIHDAPQDFYRYTRHGLEYLFSRFDTAQLEARDGYFRALATLCLRWLKQAADRHELSTICLVPVLLPLAWLFRGLNRLWPGGVATTGYFFVFRRR